MGSIVSGQFWAIEILDCLAFRLPYHFWEFQGLNSDIYVVKQDDLYFSMKMTELSKCVSSYGNLVHLQTQPFSFLLLVIGDNTFMS